MKIKRHLINFFFSGLLSYDARFHFNKFIKKNDLILDIGALRSTLTDTRKNKVIAVDLPYDGSSRFGFQKKIINKLKKRGNLELVFGDGQYLPFYKDNFDLIICTEVLEHIYDDKKAAAEMLRVLKPGGILLITVPHQEKYPLECGIEFEHHRHYLKKDLLNLFNESKIVLLRDRFKFSEECHVAKFSNKFIESRSLKSLIKYSPMIFFFAIVKVFYVLLWLPITEKIFKSRPGSNLMLIVQKL